ncbi:pepsin A1 [Apiospora phragmitis]|uniref:Pepsin A1 n=1 Tax=Apiospora phragmitis TaxID=2905665 RepID=A0ABR1W767_9PEZI
MRIAILPFAAATLSMVGLVVTTPINIPLKLRNLSNQARLPRHQTRAAASGHNIPLTDYFNRTDNQWYSDISVGTPWQNLSVLWDTGSTYLLLPQSNCSNCGNHPLFDPGSSSSFSGSPGTTVNPLFSTGADSIPLSQPEGATCHVNTETVSIGELQVKNQSLLLCDSYAPVLSQQPIDGIIGLGLPHAGSVKSWYWNLYDSGQLESPVFSFYTPAGNINGSELTLGGIDDSKYKGDLLYTNLNQEVPSGWVVDLQAVNFNLGDGALPRRFQAGVFEQGWALLDTGTAFIEAPDIHTAASMYAEISPQIRLIDPAGAWGAPCSVLDEVAPQITFTLGAGSQSANVTLPKASFNLGEIPGQPGICQAWMSP